MGSRRVIAGAVTCQRGMDIGILVDIGAGAAAAVVERKVGWLGMRIVCRTHGRCVRLREQAGSPLRNLAAERSVE